MENTDQIHRPPAANDAQPPTASNASKQKRDTQTGSNTRPETEIDMDNPTEIEQELRRVEYKMTQLRYRLMAYRKVASRVKKDVRVVGNAFMQRHKMYTECTNKLKRILEAAVVVEEKTCDTKDKL